MNKRLLAVFGLLLSPLIVPGTFSRTAEAHTPANTWVTHGPAGTLISYSLAVDPLNPTVVYTGTTDGVFKSTDFSETWVASSSGLPTDPCNLPCVVKANERIMCCSGANVS